MVSQQQPAAAPRFDFSSLISTVVSSPPILTNSESESAVQLEEISESAEADQEDASPPATSNPNCSDQGSRPNSRKRDRSGTMPPRINWTKQLKAHVQASQSFGPPQAWKDVVAEAVAKGLLPSGLPSWEKTRTKNVRAYYHNHLKGSSDSASIAEENETSDTTGTGEN